MDVNRRQFFKICAGGMAGTTVAALGFAPKAALAETRNYKLLRAKETRNTCTYCSVGCGLLMYSLGRWGKKRQIDDFPYRRRRGSPGKPRGHCARKAPACWTISTAIAACVTQSIARLVQINGSVSAGMMPLTALPG
ncbi:Formate dehydrogenase, nitrate-inducible, major subunit precursor [Serratia fonticola]|uniref:Formate dehydrogenase, nitrate-inducible, major subunit n=1 Tax=Serratia fonticola TaxID=47917 RepID=A0A4V6KN10_SERFO|nr:Formate dehydrogenase, nitrate-inducible, major subunit precursor [Serratia fonticola]